MSFKRIPPIQCLLTFEAVARLRSASKAGEELCVTVSAVSHRIRQLEDHLGAKLFGREFALTVEGAGYLAHVKSGLSSLRQLGPSTGGQKRPRVRVAMPPTFCRQLVMPKIELFRADFPEIDLTFDVAIPMADLTADQADFEVRFGTGAYTDCEFRLIQEDELAPACSPHFLNEHGPFLDFQSREELTQTRLVKCPLEPWSSWYRFCGHDDLPEPSGSQFNDIGLSYDAAASGFGAMLVRRKLGAAWIDSGRLVWLSEKFARSAGAYYLCHQPGTLERWECAAFSDWIAGVLN